MSEFKIALDVAVTSFPISLPIFQAHKCQFIAKIGLKRYVRFLAKRCRTLLQFLLSQMTNGNKCGRWRKGRSANMNLRGEVA